MKTDTLEICRTALFLDRDKMEEQGIPLLLIERILRIRDLYNFCLNYPSKKDMEIVQELQSRYRIQRSQAYDDLRIIKHFLGDLNKTSKDFHRWRFNEMIQRAYAQAERRGDTRSQVAAADKYAKYNLLDKEDAIDRGYDQIPVQPFEPTDDPTVIGLKPIPNLRDKIQSKIKQYWNEDIVDISFQNVEYNEEDIFKPKIETDETVSQ